MRANAAGCQLQTATTNSAFGVRCPKVNWRSDDGLSKLIFCTLRLIHKLSFYLFSELNNELSPPYDRTIRASTGEHLLSH
jgi:hypothetical protein